MTLATEDLVVAGIPYRRDKPDLVARARAALDAGDEALALAELLRDRDDWAPGAPCTLDDARAAITAPTMRAAMERLGYGPVADYFSYRLSDPTFLSGLTLLSMRPGPHVLELAGGVGPLLREVHPTGAGTTGVDVVFSKLWLARRFVVPDATLICADAVDGLPFEDSAFDAAFCHDALYFIPDKQRAVDELARVSSCVLIGHTHNALAENHSSGAPLSPADYAALLPGADRYDDAELTQAYLDRRVPRASSDLDAAPAIALARGGMYVSGRSGTPKRTFRPNPLVRGGRVVWPSARYAEEYGPESDYLTDDGDPRHLRRELDLPDAWGTPRPKLTFGVIGTGWVARDYVIPALGAAVGARLVCAYDPAGTPQDVPDSTTLDALLEQVEAVYIATPNDLHADAVEQAAQAGKAILCEKPMAATLADAERIANATRDVPYATAFDQRHHPAHQALKTVIDQGGLGTVTAVRIVYCCWVGPDWATDNWRADPERAGGGALLDLAPHGLDLAQHLLQDRLETLTALKQRRVHDYAVEDGAVIVGRTENDVLVQQHVAYNHPEDRPRRRLEVVGTDGIATAIDTMGQDPGGTLTVDGEPVAFDQDQSPFTAQLDAFAAAVLDGTPLTADADLRLMRLLEPWR